MNFKIFGIMALSLILLVQGANALEVNLYASEDGDALFNSSATNPNGNIQIDGSPPRYGYYKFNLSSAGIPTGIDFSDIKLRLTFSLGTGFWYNTFNIGNTSNDTWTEGSLNWFTQPDGVDFNNCTSNPAPAGGTQNISLNCMDYFFETENDGDNIVTLIAHLISDTVDTFSSEDADAQKPMLTLTYGSFYDLTVTQPTETTQTVAEVTVSATGNNDLDTCILEWDGVNSTMTTNVTATITFDGTHGDHTFEVHCNDTVEGYFLSSGVNTLTINLPVSQRYPFIHQLALIPVALLVLFGISLWYWDQMTSKTTAEEKIRKFIIASAGFVIAIMMLVYIFLV
jgi:hypothetical protein